LIPLQDQQLRALNELIAIYDEHHRFTAEDVRDAASDGSA
jgi:hypothetical protein